MYNDAIRYWAFPIFAAILTFIGVNFSSILTFNLYDADIFTFLKIFLLGIVVLFYLLFFYVISLFVADAVLRNRKISDFEEKHPFIAFLLFFILCNSIMCIALYFFHS